jgi:hypothetical protein
MEKFFTLAILLAVFISMANAAILTANASVLTATPYTQSVPGGASISDPYVAAMKMDVDGITGTLTVWFYFGSATIVSNKTTAFVTDTTVPPIYIIFNPTTGTYSVSNSNTAGTLTTGQISAVSAVMAGTYTTTQVRNLAEGFAVTNSIFGTGTTTYQW